jgi:hypothetical protein
MLKKPNGLATHLKVQDGAKKKNDQLMKVLIHSIQYYMPEYDVSVLYLAFQCS